MIGMLILILALLTTVPIYAAAVKYQAANKGLSIRGVDTTCPLIYDNDWWSDTPEHIKAAIKALVRTRIIEKG